VRRRQPAGGRGLVAPHRRPRAVHPPYGAHLLGRDRDELLLGAPAVGDDELRHRALDDAGVPLPERHHDDLPIEVRLVGELLGGRQRGQLLLHRVQAAVAVDGGLGPAAGRGEQAGEEGDGEAERAKHTRGASEGTAETYATAAQYQPLTPRRRRATHRAGPTDRPLLPFADGAARRGSVCAGARPASSSARLVPVPPLMAADRNRTRRNVLFVLVLLALTAVLAADRLGPLLGADAADEAPTEEAPIGATPTGAGTEPSVTGEAAPSEAPL